MISISKGCGAGSGRGLGWRGVLALAVVLGGCSARKVFSEPVGVAAPASAAEPGGVVYALPKSKVTVKGEQAKDGTVTYTIGTSIAPDGAARFRLRHVSSGWTEDDLNFQVDKSGLLTSTKATIKDQRAEVAVQLARSTGAIAGAIRPFGLPLPQAKPPPRYPFTLALELEDLLAGVRMPDDASIAIDRAQVPDLADTTAEPATCPYSVCYRTLLSAVVSITTPGSRQTQQVPVVLINPYRTEGIDLRSAALVTRTNTLTFESGLLVGAAVQQPSTMVAAAAVPYNVIKGFFSAFGEILTVRVSNTEGEGKLIAAETAVLTNQIAQLNAQQALAARQEQTGKVAPTSALGVGTAP